jgi:hypothetical protein
MRKPAAIRALLTAHLPDLARDPERLRMWIDKGQVRTRQTSSFSFEVAYTLNIVVLDWTDPPVILFVLLNDWLRRYQPDLVASQAADGYAFEADIMTNSALDLSIDLALTEAVTAVRREDGGWDMQIVEEPESFPDDFAASPPVPLKEIWWKDARLIPEPDPPPPPEAGQMDFGETKHGGLLALILEDF